MQQLIRIIGRTLLASPLPPHRLVPCLLHNAVTSHGVKTKAAAVRKRASDTGVPEATADEISSELSKPRRSRARQGSNEDGSDETAAVGSSVTTKKKKSRAKPASSKAAPANSTQAAQPLTRQQQRLPVPHPPDTPLPGRVPEGSTWTQPKQWVVFTDLHVKAQTLSTCLEVLRRVHEEAQRRDAGILFLGRQRACQRMEGTACSCCSCCCCTGVSSSPSSCLRRGSMLQAQRAQPSKLLPACPAGA